MVLEYNEGGVASAKKPPILIQLQRLLKRWIQYIKICYCTVSLAWHQMKSII